MNQFQDLNVQSVIKVTIDFFESFMVFLNDVRVGTDLIYSCLVCRILFLKFWQLIKIDEFSHDSKSNQDSTNLNEIYHMAIDYTNFLHKLAGLLHRSKEHYENILKLKPFDHINLTDNLNRILKDTMEFHLSTALKTRHDMIDAFIKSYKTVVNALKKLNFKD